MAESVKKSALEKIRESPIAQALDKTISVIDKFLGPSGKAWFANGLDELRQAVALGNGQIQAGNNPGLWGTITTGEATAERMAGDHEKDEALQISYEIPETKPETTLDKLRGYAKDRADVALDRMDNAHKQEHRQERGGMER
jgi:hypothetical protein